MSWFPNFSVEFTHINNLLAADVVPPGNLVTQTSQIRSLGRQVQQMFPRYPMSAIIADLHVTRSLELTVDNILEGRLIATPGHFAGDDEFDEVNVGAGHSGAGDAGGAAASAALSVGSANDYYINPSGFAGDSSSSSTPSSSPERDSTPSFDSGYEIERNSNIFGNQNDLLRESSEDFPLGDRFSKRSAEREMNLARRKELLVAQARKR